MNKAEIPMMIVTIVLLIASKGANLIIPLILARAYDAPIGTPGNAQGMTTSGDGRMKDVNRIMILVVIIQFGGVFIGFICTTIQGIIGERLVARLRCELYSAIMKQEIDFFDEHKTGELVSRLGSDTILLQTVVSLNIPEVLTGVIQSIAAIVLMFKLSSKLAGVSLGGIIFIFILYVPIGKSLGSLSKAYQDELGKAQTYSTEALGSMHTVQSFAAEKKRKPIDFKEKLVIQIIF
jgi:ABC-type multidrug transport system fused ATPase/permease subunit